jgi:hypothetical protein
MQEMRVTALSRSVHRTKLAAGVIGNDQLLQVKSLLIVRQSTLDHSDLGFQTFVAHIQWLGRRELVAERLKPVLKGENVMTKSILHGPVGGNGLPLEKDITASRMKEISRKTGQMQ